MKRILISIFFSLSFSSLSFAQVTDSLVKYSEITFNSEFEKEYFGKLFNKHSQEILLPLFLASDPVSTTSTLKSVEGKMAGIYAELDNSGLEKKSESKKIKAIYSAVHDSFFKKYELENSFSEIFTTGHYNCLSATALYSMILEKYNIPYTIKKTPNHVFLITYPNTFKILIETTDPVTGYFQFSPAFIDKYVADLRKSKLISEEEYSGMTSSELFNKYFFKDEDINLKQLLGLQYYNQALYKYEKEKYPEAFQNLQKAYYIYPSEGIKYLLKNVLLVLLSKKNYESIEDVKYYIYITRVCNEKEEINITLLSEEFERITQKQLMANSNFDLYNKSYALIASDVKDTLLRKEIDYIYNYETARAIITADKDQDIEENIKVIYSLKPENLYVRSIIQTYVMNKVSNMNNPELLHNTLEKYCSRYKFLMSNNKVASVFAACYLEISFQSFAQNDLKKGEKNLQAFEDFIKDKDKSIVNPFYVEKAYAQAATFYYRKGNIPKTKSVLKKGLEIAPDSFQLKNRLNSVN